MSIKLKYAFKKEIRMMTVKEALPFESLVKTLKENTEQMMKKDSVLKGKKLIIRYLDEDLVTVINQADWDECKIYYREDLAPNGQKLKLFVEYENSGFTLEEQLPPTWSPNTVQVPATTNISFTNASGVVTKSPHLAPADVDSGYPTETIQGWVKGNLIGKGANSEVFFGMNKHTAKFFAAKQAIVDKRDPEHTTKIKSLQKEIELMSKLNHPHIVRYLGSELTSGMFSIFLEYVPGGSIASLLLRFGSFHEKVVRLYTKQILFGLKFLHNNSILHRDIKGGNILVSDKGQIKLADFGCSKKVAVDSTGTQTLRGTALWMAPEVIRHSIYGEASDMWGVGCTVVEMATGKPPWMQDNVFESEIQAMYHIAQSGSHPRIPAHLSKNAKDFLRLSFTMDPKKRSTADDSLRHAFITDECVDINNIGKSPDTTVESLPEVVDPLWEASSSNHSLNWNNVTSCSYKVGAITESTDPDSSPSSSSSGIVRDQSVLLDYLQKSTRRTLLENQIEREEVEAPLTDDDPIPPMKPPKSPGTPCSRNGCSSVRRFSASEVSSNGTSRSLSQIVAEQEEQLAAVPVKPVKANSPRRTTSVSKAKPCKTSASAPAARTTKASAVGKTRVSMPVLKDVSTESPTTTRKTSQGGRRHSQPKNVEYSQMLVDPQVFS
eukprot:TRINITY_DN5131_c3_g2_i1.p1 TRINITY_DN5131_c3_g2~~TRINITY_DN5131_c3_g2_i1.p1  ORF type:complete len:681 (+),score=103.27 TRINITY_DN5131_c3_g2_i1:55-2043(+)